MNILIALSDRAHVRHGRARSWFLSPACEAWATCPLTENGFVRIVGHENYPGFRGGTHEAREALRALMASPGHQFWPDSVTLADKKRFPSLTSSSHLTDLYLLGLALERRGAFATLDERIKADLIPEGKKTYHVVPEN